MSTKTDKPVRLCGVLYASDTPDRGALRAFAQTLKARDWHVAGLLQEIARDGQGEKIGLDAVDIKTGAHLPLARPSKEDRENGTCGFDLGLLADTSPILLTAMREGADCLIIEKFGEREQEGKGLAEEIVKAAMMGIPTLVAVPTSALEVWNEFTGRMGTLMPHDLDCMWQWWPKWNLYKDLALGVSDDAVLNITIGAETVLVEGPNGCGISTTSQADPDYKLAEGTSLKDLALKAHNTSNVTEHALGLAAILAHYNAYDVTGPTHSGLSHFDGRDDHVLCIGSFPIDRIHAASCTSVPVDQALQHLGTNAYDGLILPSHTTGSGLLPTLLDVKGSAECVMVGAETPLSSRLFDYGLDVLSGRIIEDAKQAAELVKNGAKAKDLKAVSRYLTLEKP